MCLLVSGFCPFCGTHTERYTTNCAEYWKSYYQALNTGEEKPAVEDCDNASFERELIYVGRCPRLNQGCPSKTPWDELEEQKANHLRKQAEQREFLERHAAGSRQRFASVYFKRRPVKVQRAQVSFLELCRRDAALKAEKVKEEHRRARQAALATIQQADIMGASVFDDSDEEDLYSDDRIPRVTAPAPPPATVDQVGPIDIPVGVANGEEQQQDEQEEDVWTREEGPNPLLDSEIDRLRRLLTDEEGGNAIDSGNDGDNESFTESFIYEYNGNSSPEPERPVEPVVDNDEDTSMPSDLIGIDQDDEHDNQIPPEFLGTQDDDDNNDEKGDEQDDDKEEQIPCGGGNFGVEEDGDADDELEEEEDVVEESIDEGPGAEIFIDEGPEDLMEDRENRGMVGGEQDDEEPEETVGGTSWTQSFLSRMGQRLGRIFGGRHPATDITSAVGEVQDRGGVAGHGVQHQRPRFLNF